MSEIAFLIIGIIIGAFIMPMAYGYYRKYKLRQTIWFEDDENE